MSAAADAGTFDFALPSLGADMDTGKVIEWRHQVGDRVERGDILAVVQTEKSDIDIEVWHAGVIEELLVELGVEIVVGTPIARFRAADSTGGTAASSRGSGEPTGVTGDGDHRQNDDEGGAYPAPPKPESAAVAPRAPSSHSSAPEGGGAGPPVAPYAPADRVPASPYARRLAAERGLDLLSIRGSGPSGAVVAADVEAAIVRSVPVDTGERPSVDGQPLAPASSMRRFIAERMSKANREIPHYHLALDVDMTDAFTELDRYNETRPIAERVLPVALYVHAVARALARHREFNGLWIEDHFEPGESINVAMAISLRTGGLVTPHVEAADELGLGETMRRLQELVTAARTGNLKSRWMTGSTITITNLGDHGADLVHGVISPPQVALVGIGRPRERAWVLDGAVVPRVIVGLTLAADHRATDGLSGSRLLTSIAQRLAHLPEER